MLDLLVDSDVRMVTIVGPGGIGKSRLALAVAEVARERCPDGIVYVDLAPLSEPSLVLPTIAKSLGIEEHPGARVADRLAAAQILIVLDNMEQLADAAADLSDLLAATDALLLLVTSRRRLNVRGERVYTVEPLAVPADGTVTAAVELFLDRAGSIHPGYRPSAIDLSPRTQNSPGGWMGCRWPLSWPRPGCGFYRRPRCCNGWDISAWHCCGRGPGTFRLGSERFATPSPGVTLCCLPTPGCCSPSWRYSPAALTSRR
jgi:AAA domain